MTHTSLYLYMDMNIGTCTSPSTLWLYGHLSRIIIAHNGWGLSKNELRKDSFKKVIPQNIKQLINKEVALTKTYRCVYNTCKDTWTIRSGGLYLFKRLYQLPIQSLMMSSINYARTTACSGCHRSIRYYHYRAFAISSAGHQWTQVAGMSTRGPLLLCLSRRSYQGSIQNRIQNHMAVSHLL